MRSSPRISETNLAALKLGERRLLDKGSRGASDGARHTESRSVTSRGKRVPKG